MIRWLGASDGEHLPLLGPGPPGAVSTRSSVVFGWSATVMPGDRTASAPLGTTPEHGRVGQPPTDLRRRSHGVSREAHLSTEGPPTFPQARVPAPDVGSSRPGDHQGTATQGPSPPLGLIVLNGSVDRISEREVFRRFRKSSHRARSGPLSVVYMERDCSHKPAVGFAIGRKVGSATVRNLLRRRLRAISRDLAEEGRLPAGWYLVMVGPSAGDLPYSVLGGHLGLATAAARTRAAGE